jgi:hypothetical protein
MLDSVSQNAYCKARISSVPLYCTAARNMAAIEAGLHGCIYRATPDQGQLTHLDVSMHLNTAVLISRTFLYGTCGSEIAWCWYH